MRQNTEWRQKVIERNNYTCQECNKEFPQEELVVTNPDRANGGVFCKLCYRKWNHKQIYLNYHQQSVARKKSYHDKWGGIPETELYLKFTKEYKGNLIPQPHSIPDFYDPTKCLSIEIKRALPFKVWHWRATSKYFPGLFFQQDRLNRTTRVDQQIQKYPKPLMVIIYHGLTGEKLAGKVFTSTINESPI